MSKSSLAPIVRVVLAVSVLLTASLASVVACQSTRPADSKPTAARDRRHMTSAELERAGDHDTVYVRRLGMFEQLATHVPTDSLAHLYIAALDAPSSRGREYLYAISCQLQRLAWQYGVAADKAIEHMSDSLFAAPEIRARWIQAQDRWPDSMDADYRCDLSDLTRAPDSLRYYPRRTVAP